jgi:hypothetical protein
MERRYSRKNHIDGAVPVIPPSRHLMSRVAQSLFSQKLCGPWFKKSTERVATVSGFVTVGTFPATTNPQSIKGLIDSGFQLDILEEPARLISGAV